VDRTTALARVAEQRARREQLVAALADGSLGLDEVISARQEDRWGDVKLLTVLEAVPGARKVGTRRAMAEHGLGERIRLRDVDDEQAEILLEVFPVGDQR